MNGLSTAMRAIPLTISSKIFPVQLDGEEVNAMVYIMNLKMKFGLPSPYYYQTVLEGYHDCGLDTEVLDQAVRNSTQNFYKDYSQKSQQQTLFDLHESEYEDEDFNGEEEYLADEEAELDESDPFYFFGGDALVNRIKRNQKTAWQQLPLQP